MWRVVDPDVTVACPAPGRTPAHGGRGTGPAGGGKEPRGGSDPRHRRRQPGPSWPRPGLRPSCGAASARQVRGCCCPAMCRQGPTNGLWLSPNPLTSTIWAVSQFIVVKVRVPGVGVTSVPACPATVTLTFAVGWVARTHRVAVPGRVLLRHRQRRLRHRDARHRRRPRHRRPAQNPVLSCASTPIVGIPRRGSSCRRTATSTRNGSRASVSGLHVVPTRSARSWPATCSRL